MMLGVPTVQLVPPINYSITEEILTLKFSKFPKMSSSSLNFVI